MSQTPRPARVLRSPHLLRRSRVVGPLRSASLVALAIAGAAACSTVAPAPAVGSASPREASAPSVPEPVGSVDAPAQAPTSWKERLAQGYVYLERTGDYRRLGEAMRDLLRIAGDAGLEPAGAPFSLFYDDPGSVPTSRLRARVCLPVGESYTSPPIGMRYEVLPSAMVAYTRVAGAYPKVPKVYGALVRYMNERGWLVAGPIREIYLVNPGAVASEAELVTEVQIPWTTGR